MAKVINKIIQIGFVMSRDVAGLETMIKSVRIDDGGNSFSTGRHRNFGNGSFLIKGINAILILG
jgi:hypothetical protein